MRIIANYIKMKNIMERILQKTGNLKVNNNQLLKKYLKVQKMSPKAHRVKVKGISDVVQ